MNCVLCKICHDWIKEGHPNYSCVTRCEYCGRIPKGIRSNRVPTVRNYLYFFKGTYNCPWDCPCMDLLDPGYRKKLMTDHLSHIIRAKLIGYLVSFSEVEFFFRNYQECIDMTEILKVIRGCFPYYNENDVNQYNFLHELEEIIVNNKIGINIKKSR